MKLSLLLLFGCSISFSVFAQREKSDSLTIHSFLGKQSPEISVVTIDNRRYDIGASGKNLYVINFWFIACGPCRQELPALTELSKSYINDTTIHFLAISNIDKKPALEYVQKKTGMTYELVEQAQFAADAYKVSIYPVNIIVDRSGNVAFYEIGYHKNIAERMKLIIDKLN